MAFSFGNTNQPTFGSTAAKPTGFGAPFGATPTTQSTGFGGFGTSFGAAPQPAPTFGTSFGATASTAAPAFGSTFGAPTASVAPTFGSTFGAPATTAAPAFGTSFGTSGGLFGTPTTKPSLFGAPTTTSSLFSAPASAAPSLFGTTTTSQAPSLFGNVTSTAPSLFGTTSTTAPNLFGSTFGGAATSAAPSLFGGTTGTTPGFGLFGATATSSAPSLFGGFGTQAQGGFGGFGTTASTGFGAQAQAPRQDTQATMHQQVLCSIYAISIFNDERDDILKKWNLLQACWGTGKGYFRPNEPPVEYTPYNPFYRFKAVGYNVIPEHDNAEGLVKLSFNRNYTELNNQKQALLNGITAILGNKPNLKVNIVQMKALSETQAEIRITVTEKGVTGSSRNILSTDLANYLCQPNQKQQLTNVGVSSIIPLVTPTKSAMEEYLSNVPYGFDPQMWKAAIADNPNLSKFMPIAIYGFNDLKARKVRQEHETGIHKAFEERINNELAELKKKQAASMAKINELKHRFLHLQHRTLRILVKQESIRKNGLAIDPKEEALRGKLEFVYSQLNVPTQFKGQLNELISTVKLMEKTKAPCQPKYRIVPESQAELKEFLQMEQKGIATLVDLVKDDMASLKIITVGMQQMLHNKHSVM